MEIDNQIVPPEPESRLKLDSYCSEENGSLNGHMSPSGGEEDSHHSRDDSRASRDQQIIRDIEAEIDEKLESLSRQSNDIGTVRHTKKVSISKIYIFSGRLYKI